MTVHVSRVFIAASLLLAVFLICSCSFSRLEHDLQEQKSVVRIDAQVIDQAGGSTPLVAALVEVSNPVQPRLVNYRELTGQGSVVFLAPPGLYRVFAFENPDQSRVYHKENRFGCSEVIEAQGPGGRVNVKVVIPKALDNVLAERIDALCQGMKREIVNARAYTGTVTTLDDPAFDKDNVQMGLWEPYRFTKEVPMGIFFLGPYDPKKIPVLLIHGVSGSPRNFRRIIDALDRDRFQPWVFYYPTGFSIELVAGYLDLLMDSLCFRHRFKEVEVVAHSMGGLVARAYLTRMRQRPRSYRISDFITISTPWGGHKAALSGLKYAPAVIPVWRDIAPGSRFLTGLFERPLPEHIGFYLLFGFKNKGRFHGENNDGAVTIASQLRQEAQDEAVILRGFDETHMGILEAEEVIRLINGILRGDFSQYARCLKRTGD